ncbi:hypothetical protein, conserved [Eimeria necatrix]|uniref:Uncharacterized protein n=1 Tax=Eimeria necatrix TaxID=51315 RepID=U6MH20_9EIME|nr:hypothetical protein, conserved [Eimeria necatrix]CDJ63517.1 hypothetical protein, conserved [Eimeria necatrix]
MLNKREKIKAPKLSSEVLKFSFSERTPLSKEYPTTLPRLPQSTEQLHVAAWENVTSEKNSAGAGGIGESLNAASAQGFTFPYSQALLEEALKPEGITFSTKVAAVLTPARYAAALQWDIAHRLRSNPGVTPIIRARWHTAEEYVAAAAALQDDRAPVKSQWHIRLLNETGLALVSATQESLADDQGHRLPYPFALPSPLELLQSAFGDEYASKELATEQAGMRTKPLEAPEGNWPAAAVTDKPSARRSSADFKRTRETSSKLLRWVPFGLARIPAATIGMTNELAMGAPAGDASAAELQDNEQLFVEALSKSLPRRWLEAPDGRRLVIVLNDHIADCRNLLHLAASFSSGGTPVFVKDSEGLDPRKLLARLKGERIAGKKVAFIIFALGETEMLPMNAAFLDRAVLRVPKASDIKAFLARKEEEAAKEWETQKEEQEEMRYHMEKREAHLSELEGFTETKQETVTNLATNEQGSEWNGQNKNDFSENGQQAPVLALDPFDEYVLRFNYTEVSDLNSYAEALALELREEPLETTIRGDSHRVAIMVLAEPPETEAQLGTTWMRLNRLIHMAIAVSVIVGLLCCLCMWRLMLLLKRR